MKWYFALSQATQQVYADHVKVSVISALKNTSLEPHFLYDGEDDDLCAWMRSKGVTVIRTRVHFHEQITALRETGYLSDVALGAYLRTEIPNIDKSDDIVLYTDCDVMFLKDPVYQGPPIRYFAAAPESDIGDYSVHSINTGSLFMNLKNLRSVYWPFVTFIKGGLQNFAAFDQGAYRIFFNGLWDRMDPIHNWKPYWGYNSGASIIHFHGPKYNNIKTMQQGGHVWWRLEAMYRGNADTYQKYVDDFERLLAEA